MDGAASCRMENAGACWVGLGSMAGNGSCSLGGLWLATRSLAGQAELILLTNVIQKYIRYCGLGRVLCWLSRILLLEGCVLGPANGW